MVLKEKVKDVYTTEEKLKNTLLEMTKYVVKNNLTENELLEYIISQEKDDWLEIYCQRPHFFKNIISIKKGYYVCM